MNTEHATPELLAALAKAQGEIENATKNAQNPHFRSNYADLAEVLNTVRPVFAANGLSIMQSPSYDGTLCSVTTLIGHSAGGYITATASCQPAKSDAQGIGSATTYLRRYSAAGMAGIAQEDDDGQSAAHNNKPAKAAPKPAPAPKADPTHPNVVALQAFRTKIAREADDSGLNFPDNKAGLAWFADRLKEASAATGIKVSSKADIEGLTSDQLTAITDAVTAAGAKFMADLGVTNDIPEGESC